MKNRDIRNLCLLLITFSSMLNPSLLMAQAIQEAEQPPSVLPTAEEIQAVIAAAHVKFRNVTDGKNADYIPALANVDPALYGLAVASVDGTVVEKGESRQEFSIQSISKVFTLCRVMQELGPAAIQTKIGVDATGLAFNSIMAIELQRGKPNNSFVNAGAMATTSLIPGDSMDARWQVIMDTMNRFAARELALNEEVLASEMKTNDRNQAIAMLLKSYGFMYNDPQQSCALYTKQCSVNVNARDLAIMAATLANGGVNPVTNDQVIEAKYVPKVLAVMATAGLYDASGDWLYATGSPAKSGVGGGLLVVVPGQFGIGIFSPPLDKAGNSVRGQQAATFIIDELDANPLAVDPATLSEE